MEQRPKKLLEQVQDAIRLKHYSYQTEKTYIYWVKRYILFHNKRHPKEKGSAEIEAFLTHLAVHENVAASTQNQTPHAVLFLYREVLKQDLDLKVDAVRAKKSKYLPTVLTKDEVFAIIGHALQKCGIDNDVIPSPRTIGEICSNSQDDVVKK